MIKYLLILIPFFIISCSSSKKTTYSRSSKAKQSVAVSSSKIVQDARQQVRRPYRYGGSSPKGFDCSGLVMYVYEKHGVQLPRSSSEQARYGKSISISSAQPGDLIFFKSGGRIQHVGIVTDTKGKYPSMIHASSSKGVIEEDLDDAEYWRKRFAYIRRP